MKADHRPLKGYLRSRRAIEKFLAGESGREFEVHIWKPGIGRVPGKLHSGEAALRDWECMNARTTLSSVDEMDAARKGAGGVLELVSFP